GGMALLAGPAALGREYSSSSRAFVIWSKARLGLRRYAAVASFVNVTIKEEGHERPKSELGCDRCRPAISRAACEKEQLLVGANDLLGDLLLLAPHRCGVFHRSFQNQTMGSHQLRTDLRHVGVHRGLGYRFFLCQEGGGIRCHGRSDQPTGTAHRRETMNVLMK